MASLPRKKITQLKRFGRDIKRKNRLLDAAENTGKKRFGRIDIVEINIGGKKRFLKFEDAKLAAKFLRHLFKAHEEEAKAGRIDTQGYRLVPTKYLYADQKIGVMENRGAGINTIATKLDFRGMLDFLNEDKPRKKKRIGKTPAEIFIEKNPHITYKDVENVRENVQKNLERLYYRKKIPHPDTIGVNNIRIVGYDKIRREFLVTMIDPIANYEIGAARSFFDELENEKQMRKTSKKR